MPATVPSAPLPPTVAELAEQHELGALTATFEPQRYGWFLKSMVYVGLLTLFMAFVVPAVVYWYIWLRRLPDFNPRQAAKRLRLFEHGMIADEEAGTGPVAVRWDEMRLYEEQVQKIINGVPFPIEYTCVAMGPRASVTVTNFYRGSGTWAPAMQKAVLRAQSAKVQRAYLAGDALDFGPFDLSTAGIKHGKKLLPWSQLGDIQLSGGLTGAAVTVMKRGESAFWARTTPGSIPNLQLFLALVETYGKA